MKGHGSKYSSRIVIFESLDQTRLASNDTKYERVVYV
jgi:hypothetical protein